MGLCPVVIRYCGESKRERVGVWGERDKDQQRETVQPLLLSKRESTAFVVKQERASLAFVVKQERESLAFAVKQERESEQRQGRKEHPAKHSKQTFT